MIEALIPAYITFGIIYGWSVDESESGNTLLKKTFGWPYYFAKDVKAWRARVQW